MHEPGKSRANKQMLTPTPWRAFGHGMNSGTCAHTRQQERGQQKESGWRSCARGRNAMRRASGQRRASADKQRKDSNWRSNRERAYMRRLQLGAHLAERVAEQAAAVDAHLVAAMSQTIDQSWQVTLCSHMMAAPGLATRNTHTQV